MKKLILFIALTAVISNAIFASDALTSLTEQQIRTMLCYKWKLSFLEYKGKKKEIPAKLPASYIVFLPDGKLEQFEDKNKYLGTWTYNHSTKTVTTIDKDGTEKHTIINLDAKVFVMNGKYQGFTFNMGFSKVE
jgi:hypothetical protein